MSGSSTTTVNSTYSTPEQFDFYSTVAGYEAAASSAQTTSKTATDAEIARALSGDVGNDTQDNQYSI